MLKSSSNSPLFQEGMGLRRKQPYATLIISNYE